MPLVVLRGFYNSLALCTCTSEAAASHTYLGHFVPLNAHNRDKNGLSDTFAAFYQDSFFTEIEDLRLQFIPLTTVILIDDAYTVGNEQSLAARSAAPQRE